ncbi:tRNA epoxyqueuosine(34) reductase QueG [Lichenihabitans sp. Uapishka_5]|uniref:tRNA epoxyqueuosine(34) reductase QueG n=1 Tax=Lichenihabitans sp. Uapishka_5 TaxID=3037302 RepID=UPI003FA59029
MTAFAEAPRGGAAAPRPALVDRLRVRAAELGFEACRIVSPDAIPDARSRLDAWLAAGRHGAMGWMADTVERRGSPKALWPEVRSVVMLGMNYGPEGDPLQSLARRDRGTVSVYARHRDYHDVVKGRLKTLAGWLAAAARPGEAEVKVFVDTAPVMEKPLAAASGLGWQGKHTNLVSRDFGSWLFLGSIFTTLALQPDDADRDRCGSCRACQDACPTAAFPAPYRLDARRCISYLTIEHAGPIDRALRPLMGNRIYGCDDCLAACPWNKFAAVAAEQKLQARADLAAPRLGDLAAFDDAGFRAFFAGGPIKRIGLARFLRNVLIAIGNSGDAELAEAARRHLVHPDPAVRGAAVWALHRLLGPIEARQLGDAARRLETDPDVQREWELA